MELFENYFSVLYLIIIVLGGKLITDDRFAIQKPFWLKALMLKIDAAWRILIFSFGVGVAIHYLDPSVGFTKLVTTFLLANSFYALIFKYVFNYIESLLPKKDGQ